MTKRKSKEAPTVKKVRNSKTNNSFSGAIGVDSGFPQNQGSPWTEQISNSTTMFKNLRWYLVSNFRQLLCELYVEIGLVQTIVDVPVDDGLRGGVELKSQQLDEEQLAELTLSLDRDDDINTAGQAAKWNRLFGGAGILVLTDQDPELPLDMKSINPNTPLEFRAVDMWELFWDKQNTEGYDPSTQSEDFDFYNYYGVQVHKSRVMRLKGLTAPSFIRPRLRGWGFSVVETLVRSINQYLKATDLAFEVLDEFKVDVFKIKNLVNTLMSVNGQEQVKRRVQLAAWQKNYQNALTMDSEDDWDHKQLSFAGLGDAMKEIRMQVASDMRMPLTKLFGISAAGFNSGEDDIEVYNAMVESQVRNKLKYDLLRMCEIKCQKLFGFVPDDLSLAFKPLRVMSAEQEENVKTQKFNRLAQAKAAGEITTEEFRDACNKGNLFDVTLDNDASTLSMIDDYQSDMISEGKNDPDNPQDTDNPGADRADSQKSKAMEEGGISKDGPNPPDKKAPAPKSADMPEEKAKDEDPATRNAKWEESKHPRADDGKFGEGGGSASKDKSDKKKDIKVTPAERKLAEDFVLRLELGDKPIKVTNPLEHKIAEALVAKGAAEIVGKKNYGRIDAIKRVKEHRDDSAPVTKTGRKGSEGSLTSDTIDSEVTAKLFENIKQKHPNLSKAAHDWGQAYYSYARAVQQGKTLSKEDAQKGGEIVRALDSGWHELPSYEGKIVRDISLDISEALAMFKAGGEFETDAYSSFTAADRYLTRRKIRLQVDNSTQGKYVAGLVPDPEEKEVIVPKGVKYKIDRVEERDEAPYVIVHLSEIKK